jgi:photosystem II stability/assembly factor-like uncharacterized protein
MNTLPISAIQFLRPLLLLVMFIPFIGSGQTAWKEVLLPETPSAFTLMDFADSLNGILISENGTYAMTEDGGKSWTIDSVHVSWPVTQVKMFPQKTCWLVTKKYGNIDTILYTTNGKNWNYITAPESGKIASIGEAGFSSPTSIWLPSGKGIYQSDDVGATWLVNRQASGMRCSIVFADSLKGYLAFQTFGVGGEVYGNTFQTENGGSTWDTIKHDRMLSYRTIRFYTPEVGYYYSRWVGFDGMPSYGYVEATYDGGLTRHSIRSYEYGDVFGCILYPSGGLLLITDRNSLKPLPSDSTKFYIASEYNGLKLVDFESTSERSNWILAAGNRLFQSIGTPTAAPHRQSIEPGQYRLEPNYPNPFNPATTITYQVPKQGRVTMKVYDVLGKEVATLINEEKAVGRYSTMFDGSRLSSGTYIVRMNAGDFVKTMKVTLLK